MATITAGDINLATNFTAFSEDHTIAHYSTTRSQTTDYKRPVALFDSSGTQDYFETFAPQASYGYATLYNYKPSSDTDNCLSINGVGSSNQIGGIQHIYQFDFTEIPNLATLTATAMTVEIDLEPTVSIGHELSGPGGRGQDIYGSVQIDSSNSTSQGTAYDDTVFITSSGRQTITLTTPGHLQDAETSSDVDFPFGHRPCVFIKFRGRYSQSQLQYNFNILTGFKVYSIKAKYTYTGRAFLHTGLQTLQPNTSNNINSLIPDDSVYKNSSVLVQYGTVRPDGQADNITLKTSTDTNILNATSTGNDKVLQHGYEISSTTGNISRDDTSKTGPYLIRTQEYADNLNDGLINEVVPTMELLDDNSLDIAYYTKASNQTTAVESTLHSAKLNIAYMPLFTSSADLTANFSVSNIADSGIAQTHGLNVNEIDTVASKFNLTALGGMRLSSPEPNVSSAFDVALTPTETGLIKSTLAGTTNDLSTSFSVSLDADNVSVAHTTGTDSISSNVNIADIQPTVLIDTLVSNPISLTSQFGIANPNSDEVGVLIRVTEAQGIYRQEPKAVVSIADLTVATQNDQAGYLVLRAPSPARIEERPTRTNIYATTEHTRTLTAHSYTRTITADPTTRTLTAHSYTRVIDSKGLQE